METTKKLFQKVIETNFNNKLQCKFMIHVDMAPAPGTLTESFLENSELLIKTADNSHPVTKWKLIDTMRMQLHQLRSFMTYPSHGVDCFSFARDFLQKHPTLSTTQPMCVYYYEKINES